MNTNEQEDKDSSVQNQPKVIRIFERITNSNIPENYYQFREITIVDEETIQVLGFINKLIVEIVARNTSSEEASEDMSTRSDNV